MSHAHPQIGNSDVIYFGTLVFQDDRNVRLFPFEDDPEFFVELKLDFVEPTDEKPGTRSTISGDDNGSRITIRREFASGLQIMTKPLNFAEDDDWQYYCAVSFVARGRVDRYNVTLAYTFTRERSAK